MTTQQTRIIHKDSIPSGGFAGIVETRMVMHPSFWPDTKHRSDISHGLDDFIYLASGYFKGNEGIPMHPHKDVDIVSFIPNGAVGHEGTMGHGTSIIGPGVQVQRAGTGMKHSEFNLKSEKSYLVQMWFAPPKTALKPEYQEFSLNKNGMTSVLGGANPRNFDSNMHCQIGFLEAGKTLNATGPFVAFLQDGEATVNGQPARSGDIIEGHDFNFTAKTASTLVFIQTNK